MSTAVQGRNEQQQPPSGMIKIGTVARHFNISVDLLRLYEREGLLIPIKSPKGTRYFTDRDYAWIGTVLRLVREARLNFAGIRTCSRFFPAGRSAAANTKRSRSATSSKTRRRHAGPTRTAANPASRMNATTARYTGLRRLREFAGAVGNKSDEDELIFREGSVRRRAKTLSLFLFCSRAFQ